jgi:hypothetical protein
MVEDRRSSAEALMKRNIEGEVRMKSSILKGMLGATIAVAALAVRPAMARAEGHQGDGVRVVIQSSPINIINADPGTCDPSTFTPAPGQPFCIETLEATTALSGDFVGADQDEITILIYADGLLNFSDYESWTGTFAGHGTGSFILFEYDGVGQLDGSQTSKVRIVDGTGSGDLTGITGRGNGSNTATEMTIEFPGQN